MASISNKFHIVFFLTLFAISPAILLIASIVEAQFQPGLVIWM